MSNPRKFGPGALAIGAYVPAVARAAFESHGFPTAAVLSDWPEIVGEEFADFTAPERLIWPRSASRDPSNTKDHGTAHRRGGATLVVRVDGPRALEIQYMAQQIIERVNIYFGYGAVCEMRIVQGPVRRHEPAKDVPVQPKKDAGELSAEIEDEALHAALARLAETRQD